MSNYGNWSHFHPNNGQNQDTTPLNHQNNFFDSFSNKEINNSETTEKEGLNMKVKEIEISANIAWSPKDQYPILLAGGTAAQQLDASFDTTSSLDVYSLNLNEGDKAMPKVSSLPVENRFHSLVWSPQGVLVGGMERGLIQIFDASKLIKGEDNVMTFSKDKHTGAVNALDINPFQTNLLVSGASDSELFIWDLNKLTAPMTPGAKAQPLEEVKSVAWNRQVQHILASTSHSKCVVWDLRKNEPIIKVSDSTSGARMRYKSVVWHPEVATQLCLASEDDHSPVIQIWDLRLASSPLKTLEAHTKGVLNLAWCPEDSDLLLSCGKDNKILCWNPNSNQEGGEVVCELVHSNQWSFDVAWCPRNPAVIAASNFDSRVSIYSLMGGQQEVEQPSKSIADSFPGMEDMQPVPSQSRPKVQSVQLKQPPKWFRRPCGANFGFGGKLVTFEAAPKQANQAAQTSIITIKKVVTEQNLVDRSCKLETSLLNGNMAEFCDLKTKEDDLVAAGDRDVWKFIQANFEQDPRTCFLTLLEYEPNEMRQKISEKTGTKPANANHQQENKTTSEEDFQISDRIDRITDDLTNLDTGNDTFDAIAAKTEADAKLQEPFDICVDDSGAGFLSRALLTGNIELAVELCLEHNRMADAIVLAMQGGPELMKHAQAKYFEKSGSKEIPLIRAVVNGDWSQVINCVSIEKNWKEALVAILTYAPNETMSDLCTNLGHRLMETNMKQEALLSFICARNLDQVVKAWMETREIDESPQALQDLVEVVMTLKSAAETMSGQAIEINSGPLSSQLTKYASILAAQGALSAALNYLGQSNEDSIKELRDRLNGALGGGSQAQPRKTSAPTSRNTWNSGGSGGARVDAYTGYTGIHNPANEDLNVFNAPVPHYDAGGITQRRGSRPPVNDPYDTRKSSNDRMSAYSQPQPIQQQPPVNMSYMTPQSNFQPQPPVSIFTPEYSSGYAGVPAPPPPGPPMGVPAPPPPGPPMASSGNVHLDRDRSMSESSNKSLGIDHGGSIAVSSGPGWNDPPAAALAMAKSKAAAKTATVSAITGPITQPLAMMQPAESQHQYQPPPMNFGAQQQQQGYQYQDQQPQQSYDQFGGQAAAVAPAPPPPMNMMQPQSNNPYSHTGTISQEPQGGVPQQGGLQGYQGFQPTPPPQQQAPAALAPAPAPEPPMPIEKGPIPSEHQILQEVFDGLKDKCVVAANHPQMKRKLTDVAKKLEILYDKLRANSLPPTTTTGLHQMVQHIWAYDYNSCLQVINQMVSGGSFALLAEFLPGVKVLIQVASQLGVYIERPQ